MVWSFDILSAVIGAVCTLIPMTFFFLWAVCRAYELGHRDAERGEWIGDEE